MPLLGRAGLDAATVEELATLKPPVHTVEALLERDVEQLVRDCRLTREAILAARREAARSCLGSREEPAVAWAVSSGSAGIDALLGRGFPAGYVSELVGPTVAGKSQLCATVAANAALCGRDVDWLEAGSCSFSEDRFREILVARGGDAAAAARISVFFAADAHALVRYLDRRTSPVVVVDAPSALIAPNLGGDRNVLGHRDLALVAHALERRAKLGGALVLAVNSTVRRDDAASHLAWKPALGLTWTYAASLRLALHDDRTATLLKHSSRPLEAPPATYRQTTPQAELDSRPRGLVVHRGRCHCGAVAFEVDAPSNIVAFDCNCSSCAMRRNTHFVVPKSNLRLLRGSLTCYRFGSGVAQHLFCGVCGISPFYSPRSNPDGYAVTVHCIERGTITSLSVKQFDGVNWEAFIDKSGIRVFSRNRTKT
ncbi:hypothetical protein CTAYLR_007384 [Chrysophaeum taylorii]|uniref:CENP-V/GFA domain-containing protein n=1 Tax=Chrysophaeum taylorii TaxID=2483200 RepID=A0AAD7U5K8_9STRA|nr:hypothetical protein CTAYLR_007384 [Chrysophaeum taylorii]